MVKKDDSNFSLEGLSELEKENRWRYYIASYSSVFDTDGVNKRTLSPVLLLRNLHAAGADATLDQVLPRPVQPVESLAEGQDVPSTLDSRAHESPALSRLLNRFEGANNDERLIMRIAVNNYHPIFQPGTAEGFFEDMKEREGGEEGVKDAQGNEEYRQEKVTEKQSMNNDAMKGLSKDDVEGANAKWMAVEQNSAAADGMEKMEIDG